MNDIIKIIKALENSGILLKGVTKTIKNETKEPRGGFLSMFLGTLGASLSGDLLTGGKGMIRAGEGSATSRAKGEGAKKNPLNSLLPFHPLTNIEINEYYINEPRFNGVYSRNNLPKTIRKGAYVINLDQYENTGTHCIALFVKTNEVIYFDSFGVEHIPKEMEHAIGNKEIKANIFRLKAYDSIMCGYYCIEFINYMLKGKTLLDYTNLFSPNDLKKTIELLKEYLRMNNLELTDVNKYRLDEINKIKEYFDNEIKERKDIIKNLNKYLVGFDYLDNYLLIFTVSTGINKSLLKVTKKRKKEHNKIIALAKVN